MSFKINNLKFEYWLSLFSNTYSYLVHSKCIFFRHSNYTIPFSMKITGITCQNQQIKTKTKREKKTGWRRLNKCLFQWKMRNNVNLSTFCAISSVSIKNQLWHSLQISSNIILYNILYYINLYHISLLYINFFYDIDMPYVHFLYEKYLNNAM